ncbi:MAG: DUF4876 domain-containing protein [Bacteroides sp.]|nr:DUF4876 domain-containing protein [Bacteroides sp.]
MKKYYIPALLLCLLAFTACEKFSDAGDAETIEKLTKQVNVTLNSAMSNFTVENLKVKFVNYSEGLTYEKETDGTSLNMEDIIPGLYTITASCIAYDEEGGAYYLAGSLANKGVFPGDESLDIEMFGTKAADLMFKEIYYSGSIDWYFRDQFYELYNNSNKVIYLDGLYFANLYPTKATEILPLWESADTDNNEYGYAECVFKFPGSGTDFPLQPGESCVLAQWAANHQLENLSPNSPVNCENVEFEFYTGNAKYPDNYNVYNMEHVYYNGKSTVTKSQFLTSVFGGAYVIFQVPEGETYDPANNFSLQAKDLGSLYTVYCKIPIRYFIDAVEAIDNESMAAAKRVPATIDAGMTWVGETYCGKGVTRKRATDENGNYIMLDNGSFSYQDTNNSTDDFDRGVIPMFRRYNDEDNNAASGIPSWNPTIQ